MPDSHSIDTRTSIVSLHCNYLLALLSWLTWAELKASQVKQHTYLQCEVNAKSYYVLLCLIKLYRVIKCLLSHIIVRTLIPMFNSDP